MILAKAPLRLSFFGGSSDIPSHFYDHGGATLSAAFDKWVYAAVMHTPTPHVKVAYSTTEYHDTSSQVKHDIVREVLQWYGIYQHIEISSFADIPTVGTGLGASSAFNVALFAALERYKYAIQTLDKSWVARTTSMIETEKVGSPIGYQDHIAATYGGMVYTEYHKRHTQTAPFSVTPLTIPPGLFDCLCLVQMPHRQISANDMLKQSRKPEDVARLAQMARHARVLIEQEDLLGFGALLHDAWEQKKALHANITTTDIDDAYTRARHAGALGGKLLGAGNGGYLLLCAKSKDHKDYILRTAFPNAVYYHVAPDTKGVEIVYDDVHR